MTIRAADLPEGSIVANRDRIWWRHNDGIPDLPWRDIGSHHHFINNADNDQVDEALADGAVVLRYGYDN